MADEMVMRSVYLRPVEDGQLRQLAHTLNVTKSDLIRSAISVKLLEWLDSPSIDAVQRDLRFGQRESAAERNTARSAVPKAGAGSAVVKPTVARQPASDANTRQTAPRKPSADRKKKAANPQNKVTSASVRQVELA